MWNLIKLQFNVKGLGLEDMKLTPQEHAARDTIVGKLFKEMIFKRKL